MRTLLIIAVVSWICLPAFGQENIQRFITEAQELLARKEYKQAQLSLQDAINEIDNLLAMQVTEALPGEINGLVSEGGETTGAGVMGMMGGGKQINKRYQHTTKPENSAEVVILANAPILNAMNMYLTNPSMLGPEYKSVRVGSRRAILKSEMEEYSDDAGKTKSIRSTEIQIPLGQTLITLNARGFASEQEELAFATKLDIDKLKTLLGE